MSNMRLCHLSPPKTTRAAYCTFVIVEWDIRRGEQSRIPLCPLHAMSLRGCPKAFGAVQSRFDDQQPLRLSHVRRGSHPADVSDF